MEETAETAAPKGCAGGRGQMSGKCAPSIAGRKMFGHTIRVSFSERERELTAEALRRGVELGGEWWYNWDVK